MDFRKQLSACCLALAAAASAGPVSDVSVRVVSPWTNLVEIAYVLDADLAPAAANGRLVQTVTVRDADSGASLTLTNNAAEKALFPRAPSYAAGPHRLVWQPAGRGFCPARATVEVAVRETTDPQDYCVIDLSGGPSAARHPVSYLDEVPAGGWTDADKTDNLVLRLIRPGTFAMGDQVHGGASCPGITLTQPYYIGVFETTQRQWELMTGKTAVTGYSNAVDRAVHPVENVSFGSIRGSRLGLRWPTTEDLDATGSMLPGLRSRTGLPQLDLPTEAQWEYAARAGTTTDYGDGTDYAGTGEDANMAAVGRYQYNRGVGETTMPVGSYRPNAWGLYDMHGNVQELCLDRWTDSLAYGADSVDPTGSSTASMYARVVRGGHWDSKAAYCTSASRDSQNASLGNARTGFRLVCPAPSASNALVGACVSDVTALDLDRRPVGTAGAEPVPVDFDPLYAGVDPADGPCTVRVTLDGTNLVESADAGRLEGWTAHWYTNVLRHVVLRGGVPVGAPLERVIVSTLGPDSLTLGECVNAPALTFVAGGTGGWSRDTVTNMDEVVALRSRDTGPEGETWLETTVVGPGTLSFWWKSAGEVGRRNELYDYMELRVDGTRRATLGVGDWTLATLEIAGAGEHVLRWSYRKDDFDEPDDPREDCGWLDRVSWSGAVPGPSRDETATTPVPVKYAWLDGYPALLAAAAGDYEAAANAPTGKRDAAGNPMFVWQDFVAGTDPTDPEDLLRVSIEMRDGRPVVTWTPDLGAARRYRLRGAAAPDGPWTERSVPASDDRFFKVSVSLPE